MGLGGSNVPRLPDQPTPPSAARLVAYIGFIYTCETGTNQWQGNIKMPMAHVFIVDDNTFPVHLEYQFAGTTAGPTRQRSTSLYADIARVRPGDRAYFYLLRQGFYGPFKVDPYGQGVWWDRLYPTFLQDRLRLRLIYRVQVINDNCQVPIDR